jgi:hypothetical protein
VESVEWAVRKEGEVTRERLEPGCGEGRRGVMYWDVVGERREEPWCGREGPVVVGEGSGIGALCSSVCMKRRERRERTRRYREGRGLSVWEELIISQHQADLF